MLYFIAAGVLRLVDQGRIHLDDPIAKYIPSFANVKVFAGGTADAPVLEAPTSPLTVRQLLNHTSGLAYGLTAGPVDTIFSRAQLYDASRTLEQFTDSLARLPLLFHPGSKYFKRTLRIEWFAVFGVHFRVFQYVGIVT